MKFMDSFIRKHCCFGQGSKTERRLVEDRRSVLDEFNAGESINSCIRNHPRLEVISARVGNKSTVIFDRDYRPENFAVVQRDRLSMYYDKNTLEAQVVVYEWEEK